jgi:DNA-binding CsgD family transcriptional regulator
MGGKKIARILNDQNQQSYIFFTDLTRLFLLKNELYYVNLEYDYLMYIEKYLLYRLNHWYLTEHLCYNYDRNAGKMGKRKYSAKYSLISLDRWGLPISRGDDRYEAEMGDILFYLEQESVMQATCIALLYCNGLTTSQIAEKLVIPEGTIKSYLSRARSKLKVWLEDGVG